MSHVLTDDEATALINIGVSASELVRLGFPDASDDFCDWMLWERTAFPLVRGVHDIADSIAYLVEQGPRCDELGRRGQCLRRVETWGQSCWQHHPEPDPGLAVPARVEPSEEMAG